jgi:hypothetical protein
MNRRKLLISSFAWVLGLAITHEKSVVSSVFGLLESGKLCRRQRVHFAQVGQVYVALPNTLIKLPLGASDGSIVHVIVDQNSLLSPCQIIHETGTILNEVGPVDLDTLAILRFKFDVHSNNWTLS